MMEAVDHVSDSDFILEWEIICSDESSDEALIPARPAVQRIHQREDTNVGSGQVTHLESRSTIQEELRQESPGSSSFSINASPSHLQEDISPSTNIPNDVTLSLEGKDHNIAQLDINSPGASLHDLSPMADEQTAQDETAGGLLPRYNLRARRDEQLHPYKMEKLNAKNIGIYERTELGSQDDGDYTPPFSPIVRHENSEAQLAISQIDSLSDEIAPKSLDDELDDTYNSSSDDERIFLSRAQKGASRRTEARPLRRDKSKRITHRTSHVPTREVQDIAFDAHGSIIGETGEAEEYDVVESYRPHTFGSKQPSNVRNSAYFSHRRKAAPSSSSLSEFHEFMRIFNGSALPDYRRAPNSTVLRTGPRKKTGVSTVTGTKNPRSKRRQISRKANKSTARAVKRTSHTSRLVSQNRARITAIGSTVVEYRDGSFANRFLSELGNDKRPSFLDELSQPLSTSKLPDPGLIHCGQAGDHRASIISHHQSKTRSVSSEHPVGPLPLSKISRVGHHGESISFPRRNDITDLSDICHILRSIPAFDLPELFPGCADLESPDRFLLTFKAILQRPALLLLGPHEALLAIKILATSFFLQFPDSRDQRFQLTEYIVQAVLKIIRKNALLIRLSGNILEGGESSSIHLASQLVLDVFKLMQQWWDDERLFSSLFVRTFEHAFDDVSEHWGLIYAVTDILNSLNIHINWDGLLLRELRSSTQDETVTNYHRLRNSLVGCHKLLASHQWKMNEFKFLTAMFTVFGDRRWKNFETSFSSDELVLLPKFISSETEAYDISVESDSVFSLFMKIVILVLRRSSSETGGRLSQVVRAEGHRADCYGNANIQQADLEALANDYTVNLVGAKYLKRYKWIRILESRIKLPDSHAYARNLSLSALFHSLMIVFDAKNNGDIRSSELAQTVDWLEKLVETTVKSGDDTSAIYISRAIYVFIQKRAGTLPYCPNWTDILTPLVILWERFGFNVKQNVKSNFVAALEVERKREKLAEELVFTDERHDGELPQPARPLAHILKRLKFEDFLEDGLNKTDSKQDVLLQLRFVCEVQSYIVKERVSTWYALLCGYGYGSVMWNSPGLRHFEPMWLKQAYLLDPRAFADTSVADLMNEKFFIQLLSVDPSKYLMDLFAVMKNIHPLSKASWGTLRPTIQEQREEIITSTVPFMNRKLFNMLKEEVKRQKALPSDLNSGFHSTNYQITVAKHFENYESLATRMNDSGSLSFTQVYVTEALKKWQISGDLSTIKEFVVAFSQLDDEKWSSVMRLMLIDFPKALGVTMEKNDCDCTFFALPLILFAKRYLWDSVVDKSKLRSCMEIYLECTKIYSGLVSRSFSKQHRFALWGTAHMLFDIGTRLSKLLLHANSHSISERVKSAFHHLHRCGEFIFCGNGSYDYFSGDANSLLIASIAELFENCNVTRDWLAEQGKVALFSTELAARRSFFLFCRHFLLVQELPVDALERALDSLNSEQLHLEPHLHSTHAPDSHNSTKNSLLENVFI